MWNYVGKGNQGFLLQLASVAQSDASQTGDQEVEGLIPCRVWQHSFMDIDHEIFSVVILFLPTDSRRAVISFWWKKRTKEGKGLHTETNFRVQCNTLKELSLKQELFSLK